MSELGFHVRFRLKELRAIASSAEERRLVARVVLEQGREAGLLTFDLPVDHLHAALLSSRLLAGRFSRGVESSLRQRFHLPIGFIQYEPKPIEDGYHLRNVVRYILNQPTRHGVHADPFREASNLPDLLGLRLLGGHTVPLVRAWLPRLERAQLLEWLGVSALEPADGPPQRVPEAALRASGLTCLGGKHPKAVAARRAAVVVIGSRLPRGEIAELLGVSQRSVWELRAASSLADPSLVQAIRLQLALEAQLGPRAAPIGSF